MERRVKKYEANLAVAASYLSARGITPTTASRYRFGVVGADPEPGDEHVVGRLAIPYLTPAGPVDLKYRCLQHVDCKAVDCPKYLYADGTTHRLYNVQALLEPSPVIVLTEGEIDALTVHELVGVPAVGYPGASAWKPFWSRCFHGHELVLILADGDEPGVKAAKEVKRYLPQGQVIRLPNGEDANSLVLKEGPEAFRKRLGL